jgi:hypothetical protein
MRLIPLSQGKSVIVDDADYPLNSDFKWFYRGNKDGTQGYAIRHAKIDGAITPEKPDNRKLNQHPQDEQNPNEHDQLRFNAKAGYDGCGVIRYGDCPGQ